MYTAQELIWATQLAYCNFTSDMDEETKSIREIFKEEKGKIFYDPKLNDPAAGDTRTMREDTKQFIKDVADGKICQGWKVIDVRNEESVNGLYAIMIETAPGEAIIAFRGSESVNVEQIVKDWVQADMTIMNGDMTAQELAACRYLDYIGNNDALKKYQDIAITGHSLGGDLALVSTIYTATDECKTDMSSRIKQSVSMDGPGHPQEFLDKYEDAINEMQGVMTHYQWSLVGSILKSVCLTDNYIHVSSQRFHEDELLDKFKTIIEDRINNYISTMILETASPATAGVGLVFSDFMEISEIKSYLFQHSTASLYFTENGGMITTDTVDPVAALVYSMTNALDDREGTQQYCTALVNLLSDLTGDAYDVGLLLGEGLKEVVAIGVALEEMNNSLKRLIVYTMLDIEVRSNGIAGISTWENILEDEMCNSINDYYNASAELSSLYLQGIEANIGHELLHKTWDMTAKLFSNYGKYCIATYNMLDGFAEDIKKSVYNKIMQTFYKTLSYALQKDPEIIIWFLDMQKHLLIHQLGIPGYSGGKDISDYLKPTVNIYRHASNAVAKSDPLVVDIDGDGFDLISVEEGVYFDEDNRNLKEKTQWVAPKDGLLAIDLNEDGVINDGSELFGTSTMLKDETLARSGFEALAQYDENGDGVIDGQDDVFSKLLIWQDKNSDGISQQDELLGIQDFGVTSISLNTQVDNGINTSAVTLVDGSSTKTGEFTFDAHLYDVTEKEEVEYSDEIKELPDVRAIGNIASLRTLMQTDESGQVKEAVTQFGEAVSSEEREAAVTRLLYLITGADQVASNSRGGLMDAKRLTVIEQFMGEEFIGTRGRNPINAVVPMLEKAYKDIYELYYNCLNEQTFLKKYLNMTCWFTNEAGEKYLDTALFDAYVKYSAGQNEDMREAVAEVGRYIKAMNSENKLNFVQYLNTYMNNQEYFSAIAEHCSASVRICTPENDVINGGNESVYILGLEGNDVLKGGSGDDILVGGAGNDTLNGGSGSDVYFIGAEDGNDTIINYDRSEGHKEDRLVFGEGILEENIRLSRLGNNLLLTNVQNGQVTTIINQFLGQDYALGKIEFSNGTVWDPEFMEAKLRHIEGSDEAETLRGNNNAYGYDENEVFYGYGGNDTIYGGKGNDVIYGGEGNDRLEGGDGDDHLYGGAGNDTLNGGSGSDVYYIGAEDGNDTVNNYDTSEGRIGDKLVFGEGIRKEDIRLSRFGSNLLLTNVQSGQVTTIASQFNGQNCALEKVEFADGTVWDLEFMEARLRHIEGSDDAETLRGNNNAYGYDENEVFYGYGGNDSIIGGSGDDILYGGAGNDTLNGGSGSDVYYIGAEDGNDTVNNYDTSEGRTGDRLVFGEGIRKEDIRLSRFGSNLILTNVQSGQVTTIANQFGGQNYALEKVEFADGTVWNLEFMEARLRHIEGSDDAETLSGNDSAYGYDSNEVFYAGAGNDTVYGYAGDDTLYGEGGDDRLYGGNGDDILVGGAGNDMLYGGNGSDTYIYNIGDGNDLIQNYDSSDSVDSLNMGVNAMDVVFERMGQDLKISILDEEGSVTVKNWFVQTANQLDTIETQDGYSLDGSQIELLIQAMASFESTNGLSWQEAARLHNEEFNNVMHQYWLKQVG